MGWNSADTIAFVEMLIVKNVVVLRTEAVDRAADPERKAQSRWRRARRRVTTTYLEECFFELAATVFFLPLSPETAFSPGTSFRTSWRLAITIERSGYGGYAAERSDMFVIRGHGKAGCA
jgi:hypothetical protein